MDYLHYEEWKPPIVLETHHAFSDLFDNLQLQKQQDTIPESCACNNGCARMTIAETLLFARVHLRSYNQFRWWDPLVATLETHLLGWVKQQFNRAAKGTLTRERQTILSKELTILIFWASVISEPTDSSKPPWITVKKMSLHMKQLLQYKLSKIGKPATFTANWFQHRCQAAHIRLQGLLSEFRRLIVELSGTDNEVEMETWLFDQWFPGLGGMRNRTQHNLPQKES